MSASAIRLKRAMWATREAVQFHQTHRHTPDELHHSERAFLPEAAAQDLFCKLVVAAASLPFTSPTSPQRWLPPFVTEVVDYVDEHLIQ